MSRLEEYLKARKGQLNDDMKKAHDQHDAAWYNRLIQELDWVEKMSGIRPMRNCYMEGQNKDGN